MKPHLTYSARQSARAVLIAGVILIVAVTIAFAETLIDNTGDPITESMRIDPTTGFLAAQQFNRGSDYPGYWLSSVSVVLSATAPVTITAEVRPDTGLNFPDMTITLPVTMTLQGAMPTDGLTHTVMFKPSYVFQIPANSYWWVVLQGAGPSPFYWAMTNLTDPSLNYGACVDDGTNCSGSPGVWYNYPTPSTYLLQINHGVNPTAVTLSSFKASAPSFDLGRWLTQFLGR